MNVYNENDPFAAAWLRALIAKGEIADGTVDERDIRELEGRDLDGARRVHLFAGIGGWDLALELAGWPADRPVWTGSCPCQPFSVAGKRKGHEDERHLWPEMLRLVRECRPATIVGEQVASSDGRRWLAGVFADLEAVGYRVAGADLCAASAGAPHIRQRLWWVALTAGEQRRPGAGRGDRPQASNGRGLADAERGTSERHGFGMAGAPRADQGREAERERFRHDAQYGGATRGLGNAIGSGCETHVDFRERKEARSSQPANPSTYGGLGDADLAGSQGRGLSGGRRASERSPWAAGVALKCADGVARRVEPGVFPLAPRFPRGVVPDRNLYISESYAQSTGEARIARLRGYGNAIVPQVAAAFIRSVMEAEHV